jgi:hypothetical protein
MIQALTDSEHRPQISTNVPTRHATLVRIRQARGINPNETYLMKNNTDSGYGKKSMCARAIGVFGQRSMTNSVQGKYTISAFNKSLLAMGGESITTPV